MDIKVNKAKLINMNEHEYFNKMKEPERIIDGKGALVGAEKGNFLEEEQVKRVLGGLRAIGVKSKDELIDHILIQKKRELRKN